MRRFLAIAAAFSLVVVQWFAGALPANAVACGGEAYVVVFEFGTFETSHDNVPNGYGSSRVICYPNSVSNFGTLEHDTPGLECWELGCESPTMSHICAGGGLLNWNDCTSSIKWRGMPSNGALRGCFYENTNYTGLLTSRALDASLSLTNVYGDNRISSFRWRLASTGC